MDYIQRQAQAIEAMRDRKLDGFTVSHLPNIQYLCGFTGSAGVLAFAGGRCSLFTDGRYTEQARKEVLGARVVIARGPALSAAAKWLTASRATVVGIEADHMTVRLRSALNALLSRKPRLRETSGFVEQLRILKDEHEIKLIRKAVNLGSALLDSAVRAVRPGIAEIDVAAEIEFQARKLGASGMSFETIVASGARSALPHGVASEASIRKGFVVMDFGVILAHYCSDMTRTVHVGRVPLASRQLYNAVREAQQAAINAVAPGTEIGMVDAAARRVLKRAGFGKYFTHSTGHGVGLEIHEQPRVAAGVKDLLQPGMVITIEPGAYLPGRAGVRIEDMVLVTETGSEVLTSAPKDLIVL